MSNLDLADMQELRAIDGGRHVAVMAYSPIDQARLLGKRALVKTAERVGRTPAQLALANPLTKAEAAELDRLFPPPHGPVPLEVIWANPAPGSRDAAVHPSL